MTRRAGLAWASVALLLAAGAGLVQAFAPGLHALDWEGPASGVAEPWRSLTMHVVHWNAAHLSLNLAGCVLLAALGRPAKLPGAAAMAWLAAWPLGPWLAQAVSALTGASHAHLGGLSGVLHAGVAVAATWLVVHTPASQRPLGLALAIGLVAKLGWELALGPQPLGLAPDGSAVATSTALHLGGSLGGTLAALAVLSLTKRRPARAVTLKSV